MSGRPLVSRSCSSRSTSVACLTCSAQRENRRWSPVVLDSTTPLPSSLQPTRGLSGHVGHPLLDTTLLFHLIQPCRRRPARALVSADSPPLYRSASNGTARKHHGWLGPKTMLIINLGNKVLESGDRGRDDASLFTCWTVVAGLGRGPVSDISRRRTRQCSLAADDRLKQQRGIVPVFEYVSSLFHLELLCLDTRLRTDCSASSDTLGSPGGACFRYLRKVGQKGQL